MNEETEMSDLATPDAPEETDVVDAAPDAGAEDEAVEFGAEGPIAYSSGGDDDDEPLSPFAQAFAATQAKDEDAEAAEAAAAEEAAKAVLTGPASDADEAAPEADAPTGEAEDGPAEADGAADADADSADADAADEADEEEVEPEPEPEPISPYDMPGGWYVIHSYSGYEKKVQANLMTRTSSMHMEDRIFEVVIPMEDVVEIKNGQRVQVPKKMFPGYILVRMYLDDDSWYAVRNTPGVTGFVGGGSKPTPLSRREVERFLGAPKAEEKKSPRFKPAWEIGETVRVVAGPFADFNGVIEDINVDQQKVTVLVSIFGRDTPMELNFEDIQKQ